jgi:hypothetical protein
MHRTPRFLLFIACAALPGAGSVLAHHTYSMFDTSRTLVVEGTMAKFEWKNPHTYLWVYVPVTARAGQYEAWAFENGSPSLLSKLGWSKEWVKPNDKVTVVYAPLRSGKPGGHCLRVTRSDGRSLECVGFGATPTAAGR